MTTKTATANGLTEGDANHREAIDGYLKEMAAVRKRMKSADARIRRADAVIRRSLDATRSILRHVQASR